MVISVLSSMLWLETQQIEKKTYTQMLHVGNMYLHFPLNVAIVHLMFANEKYIRCIWDMDCKYLVMNFGISPTQTNKKLCDLFAMVK